MPRQRGHRPAEEVFTTPGELLSFPPQHCGTPRLLLASDQADRGYELASILAGAGMAVDLASDVVSAARAVIPDEHICVLMAVSTPWAAACAVEAALEIKRSSPWLRIGYLADSSEKVWGIGQDRPLVGDLQSLPEALMDFLSTGLDGVVLAHCGGPAAPEAMNRQMTAA